MKSEKEFRMQQSSPIWGTQVYPTKESINNGVNKPDDLGIFVGFKSHDNIYVIKMPRHTVHSYHYSFWTIKG